VAVIHLDDVREMIQCREYDFALKRLEEVEAEARKVEADLTVMLQRIDTLRSIVKSRSMLEKMENESHVRRRSAYVAEPT